jgi:hypothetical protein
MDKKGQFFLIAALVIVGIIATLAAVNFSTKTPKEDVTIYDLSKEIDYESNQLIDYGVYKGAGSMEINSDVLALVGNYSSSNPDTDILVVYGNEQLVRGVLFSKESTGVEAISAGGVPKGQFEFSQTAIPLTTIIKDQKNVEVMLENKRLANFTLNPGENFYLILQKEVGGERLVAQE